MLADVNIWRNLTRRVTVNKLLTQVTWKKRDLGFRAIFPRVAKRNSHLCWFGITCTTISDWLYKAIFNIPFDDHFFSFAQQHNPTSIMSIVVNRLAMNSTNFLVVCYFWPWPYTEHNSCFDHVTRALACKRKTKDCAVSWTFQHKSWHLCSLLWCLPGFITIPMLWGNFGIFCSFCPKLLAICIRVGLQIQMRKVNCSKSM